MARMAAPQAEANDLLIPDNEVSPRIRYAASTTRFRKSEPPMLSPTLPPKPLPCGPQAPHRACAGQPGRPSGANNRSFDHARHAKPGLTHKRVWPPRREPLRSRFPVPGLHLWELLADRGNRLLACAVLRRGGERSGDTKLRAVKPTSNPNPAQSARPNRARDESLEPSGWNWGRHHWHPTSSYLFCFRFLASWP
jgi:hypothetical protein